MAKDRVNYADDLLLRINNPISWMFHRPDDRDWIISSYDIRNFMGALPRAHNDVKDLFILECRRGGLSGWRVKPTNAFPLGGRPYLILASDLKASDNPLWRNIPDQLDKWKQEHEQPPYYFYLRPGEHSPLTPKDEEMFAKHPYPYIQTMRNEPGAQPVNTKQEKSPPETPMPSEPVYASGPTEAKESSQVVHPFASATEMPSTFSESMGVLTRLMPMLVEELSALPKATYERLQHIDQRLVVLEKTTHDIQHHMQELEDHLLDRETTP